MNRPLRTAALALLGVFLAFATCAAAEPVAAETQVITFGNYIEYSGWVGLVIIGVGLCAVWLILVRCYQMRRERIDPEGLAASLEQSIRTGRHADALAECAAHPSVLADSVQRALVARELFLWSAGGPGAGPESDRRRLEYDALQVMRPAIDEAIESSGRALERGLFALDFCAAIAPLLGLFGTVTGMQIAFNVLSHTPGQPEPGQLATPISQALLTTIGGLIVAMPTLLAVGLLRKWIDQTMDRIKALAYRVIAPSPVAGRVAPDPSARPSARPIPADPHPLLGRTA